MENSPADGGDERASGQVVDFTAPFAARLSDIFREPAPAATNGGAEHASAYPHADLAEAPSNASSNTQGFRPSTLAVLGDGTALDGPLQNLKDGFALWGRAIHDAVAQEVRRLGRDVEESDRKAARAEEVAAAAHAAVQHVPDHVRSAVQTSSEAARLAREASGQLIEILRNLAQHTGDIGRLASLIEERTGRLGRLESGASALPVEVAALRQEVVALAAANRLLHRRAGHLRIAVILAFAALLGFATWTGWPGLTSVATLWLGS